VYFKFFKPQHWVKRSGEGRSPLVQRFRQNKKRPESKTQGGVCRGTTWIPAKAPRALMPL